MQHPSSRPSFKRASHVLCALTVCLTAARAHAAGFEDSISGTVALGRAAAMLRVSDFMAIYTNPANLARIPSLELGAELRLPVFGGCFDRAKDNSVEYRTEDRDRGFGGSESFAKVCNEGGPVPAGNFGLARGFDSGWGFGIGFFTPAATPSSKYGDPLIVTQQPSPNETAKLTPTGTESPNRFLLLERETLGGFLMAGIGAQPSPFLRFGLSAGIGFLTIRNVSMASVLGGTFVDQEILVDVHAADWMIPRATASLVLTPTDAWEIGLVLTSQGSVGASGDVEMTANGFVDVPLRNCRDRSGGGPGPHCRIDDASLSVPFPPFEAVIGVRYSDLARPRGRAFDPQRDERWDIEFNAYWSQTSAIDEVSLQLYEETPGSPGAPVLEFSSAPESTALSLPPVASVPRKLRDTFGFRLGGEVAVLPETFSARAGISYETRAVPAQYMNIDMWPVAKLGLHLGASLRLEQWTVALALSHVFYQEVEVAVGKGAVREIVSQNMGAALPVNEGSYNATLDVISVQANLAF